VNTLPAANPDWTSRERLLVVVLLLVTGLAVALCALLALPFLPALAWALALAVVAYPVHRWLAARLPGPDLAAGVSLLLVAVLLVGPSIIVSRLVLKEAANGLPKVGAAEVSSTLQAAVPADSSLGPLFAWLDKNVDIQGEATRVLGALLGDVASLLTGSVWAFGQLLLTLFILFYFFRDGPALVRNVRRLLPLSEAEADQVLLRVDDTIHATVYGTFLVALIQGTLGGLMFAWLGLPAPVTWGMVMALFAIIPYLGAFVIWAPAAAYLAVQGHTGNALLLTAWGLIAIGLIDNLLYPMFVGKRLRQHTLLVFIATIGGLSLFGASGIILGPVIFAVTQALLVVWRLRLTRNALGEPTVLTEPAIAVATDLTTLPDQAARAQAGVVAAPNPLLMQVR